MVDPYPDRAGPNDPADLADAMAGDQGDTGGGDWGGGDWGGGFEC